MAEHKQGAREQSKKLRTAVIVVSAIIAFDLTVSGFLKFGYYVVRCGGVPLSIEPGSSFAGGYRASYTLPGDRYYAINASKGYACTEQEAKAMGIEIDKLSEKGNERLRSNLHN